MHKHFEALRNRYYDVTHRNGHVWIEDSFVLRRETDKILADRKCKKQFTEFISLPSVQCDHVYSSYVHRIETMMGIEVVRQATESLKRKGEGTLESLRTIKQKKLHSTKLET